MHPRGVASTNSPPHVRNMHIKFRRLKYAHTCLMKFSVGDYYVKLGSSPGSIDSEFKHPYLINSLLLPIFLDLLMALVILFSAFFNIFLQT